MNKGTSVILALLIAVVVGGALWLGLASGRKDVCAGVNGKRHTVIIRGGSVSDKNLVASRCDTLIITNRDIIIRNIAFGVHNKHTSYDGQSERTLTKNQSLTVALTDTGRYHWHDHLHDEVEGYFTVTE